MHHTVAIREEVSLHFVSAGSGPPLVLLHGGFQTWRCWRRVLPALSTHFHVLAVDLPGIGDSSHPAAGYDVETVARDMLALLDAQGIGSFFAAGHDLGAGVTVALAALAPERVQAFAFMEYLLCGFGFEQALTPRPDNHHLWFAALNMVPAVPEMLIRGHEREYLTYLMRQALTANPEAVAPEDLDDYVRCYAAPDGWRPLCELFRATWQNAELNRRYAQTPLTMPALALGGQYSAGSFVAESLRAVATNVQEDVAANTAHWLPEEQPDWTAQKLLAFFLPLAAGPGSGAEPSPESLT